MQSIILPYINPDLDGVACAIALANLRHPLWTAHALGTLDSETLTVLDALDLKIENTLPKWADIEKIWLVDTHHPNQLPADLPNDRVRYVTDHHPGGDPQRYVKAEIENEPVGAAASLVAERFFREGTLTDPLAQLLQAAILSNTLHFKAPATSPRDRAAFATLADMSPLPATLIASMKAAKNAKLQFDTDTLIESDVKLFDTSRGKTAVSQLELGGACSLLTRSDIFARLDDFVRARQLACAILVLVDLECEKSAVVTTDPIVTELLARILKHAPDALGIIHVDRLLQRKSDIIPHILLEQ